MIARGTPPTGEEARLHPPQNDSTHSIVVGDYSGCSGFLPRNKSMHVNTAALPITTARARHYT